MQQLFIAYFIWKYWVLLKKKNLKIHQAIPLKHCSSAFFGFIKDGCCKRHQVQKGKEIVFRQHCDSCWEKEKKSLGEIYGKEEKANLISEFCLLADKQSCYLATGISAWVWGRLSTFPVPAAGPGGLHVSGVTYTGNSSCFSLSHGA